MQYNKGNEGRSADNEEECKGGDEDSGLCDILWFIFTGRREEGGGGK